VEDFARDSKTQQLISLDGASRRSMRHWSAREAPSVEGMTPRAHPGSNPDCSFIFASRAGDKDGRQRATAAGEQQRRKRLAGILNERTGRAACATRNGNRQEAPT
jgi:hypothetical protein